MSHYQGTLTLRSDITLRNTNRALSCARQEGVTAHPSTRSYKNLHIRTLQVKSFYLGSLLTMKDCQMLLPEA